MKDFKELIQAIAFIPPRGDGAKEQVKIEMKNCIKKIKNKEDKETAKLIMESVIDTYDL